MEQPPERQTVILFNPPAQGTLEAQLDSLARVLATIARLMLDLLSSLRVCDTLLERTLAVLGSAMPRPAGHVR